MTTITIILLSITILFVCFALLKKSVDRLFKIKLCALCASVATTWLAMLLLKSMGFTIDMTLLAILMGESITGIFYRMTYKLKRKPKHHPLIGLLIILLGTTIVYGILEGVFAWTSLIILSGVAGIILVQRMKQEKPKTKLARTLMKKLEHCCA